MEIEELYKIFLKYPKVCTDSRKVTPGGLFFALKGDRFNGNIFAAKALEDGAARAIVDDPSVCADERYLLVDNSLKCLQELALHHRRHFLAPVIAITGSNGKTTTKELISQVLSSHYCTHFTRGNLNNHIGVPLSLLSMPKATEVAIIEMGANHQGEIDFLCRIAEPTHGVITNIGKAHLEGFGGIEGVKKGKSELYRYLAETDGVVFINKDVEYLTELAGPVKRKLYFRQSEKLNPEEPNYEIKLLTTNPFVRVAFLEESGKLLEVNSHLIGHYNFLNLMTAIGLGKYFKVPAEKIKQAIESYIPQNNRSQIIHRGTNVFILDAYNANPSSMEEAIQNFFEMDADRKIAILGDMLELGEFAEQEHQRIVQLALEKGFEEIILVGSIFTNAAQTFQLPHFENVELARQWWEREHIENAHVLLKGSRGIRLEDLMGA